MGPKFNDLMLLGNGKLEVSGPFDTHGEVLDDVVVRFLIIADDKQTIFGTATIPNDKLAPCSAPIVNTHPVRTRNHKRDVQRDRRHDPGLRVGDRVRAIGLSVAVKKADGHDPPAFETFTWCVTVKVVETRAANARSRFSRVMDGSRRPTQSIVWRKSSTRSRNASGSSTCGMWLDSSKIVHCAPGMRS